MSSAFKPRQAAGQQDSRSAPAKQAPQQWMTNNGIEGVNDLVKLANIYAWAGKGQHASPPALSWHQEPRTKTQIPMSRLPRGVVFLEESSSLFATGIEASMRERFEAGHVIVSHTRVAHY